MNALEIVGLVGEILSWAGAIIGIPMLIASLALRARDRERRETPVTIVDDLDRNLIALWTIGTRTYSRKLSGQDRLTLGNTNTGVGYVSPHHPEHLDLHKRSHAERICTPLAIITVATAIVGFLASLAAMLW